ncbi:MAG: DUF3805 domain-containing protein [Bacteroidia bacterium]|jgi:O-glycosyl hydrolase|nr:DUF3805 domain-containing protein [Bacteroidia bacterium]
MSTSKRFVSLHGFFAITYPTTWTQETDEAGHYLFYNQNGGQGVLRVMIMDNEFRGDGAEKLMLEEVYNQNKLFEPDLYMAGKNPFVHFAKSHEVGLQSFTVYYWATAKLDKVVLFAYTVQTAMKNMPVPEQEKSEIEQMVGTFEFLAGSHE